MGTKASPDDIDSDHLMPSLEPHSDNEDDPELPGLDDDDDDDPQSPGHQGPPQSFIGVMATAFVVMAFVVMAVMASPMVLYPGYVVSTLFVKFFTLSLPCSYTAAAV